MSINVHGQRLIGHLMAFLCLSVPGILFAQNLPQAIHQSAKVHGVDLQHVSLEVVGLTPGAQKHLSWRESVRVRPASSAKVITTLAALETLGPDWRFKTTFALSSLPKKGRLKTPLYLIGGGDPALVIEDFRLLVDKLKMLGIEHIEGDLIVDRTLYEKSAIDRDDFDGQSKRPYNVLPDPLLVNYKSVVFEMIPDQKTQQANVFMQPPLDGVTYEKRVALRNESCEGWRGKLQARFDEKRARVVFDGALPLGCGEKTVSMSLYKRDQYLERLFRGIWQENGRTWSGHVREGVVSPKASYTFSIESDALSDEIKKTNKWSNNVMARMLFLNMAMSDEKQTISLLVARKRLVQWLEKNVSYADEIYIENGSGLSQKTKLSARAMTSVLKHGWQSPYRSEFMASLPITGVDGTMRMRAVAPKNGRIKTGFLHNVRSVAGYVRAKDGHDYAVFAVVEGKENVPNGIAFLDDVLQWVYETKK